jgi:hypothetical protein
MLARSRTAALSSSASDLRRLVDGAATVTPGLIARIVAHSPRVRETAAMVSPRLRQLFDAQAWTDVALALIAIELPRWSLVGLAFDDGEWTCTLARHPQMPAWLDDCVDAHHADLVLAILAAFVDACDMQTCDDRDTAGSISACRPGQESFIPVCCDDFA